MRKMTSKSILRILFGVLCLIFFAGLPNIANAGDITVDESDIRDPGEFKGPLPIIITAFAKADGSTFDILPPGSGETYIFSLFDTGATSVAIGTYRGDPEEDGDDYPYQSTWDYLNSIDPNAAPEPFPSLLSVRINGMGTINEVTLGAPIGAPFANPEFQQSAYVGPFPGSATLIGARVANEVVAFIDNRAGHSVTRGPYFGGGSVTGPDIHFWPPTYFQVQGGLAGINKKLDVRLLLSRFGSTDVKNSAGVNIGQRYYLQNVTFNDERNSESHTLNDVNDGFNVFWDSATNYSAISQALADDLGLPSTQDFPCSHDGVIWKGYVIDSVVMTGTDENYQPASYTIENARICVDPSAIPFNGVAPVRIGTNLFEQVQMLFHGPYDQIQIISDLIEGDFDRDNDVDCDDYQMLMAEINRPTESINIEGNTRIRRPNDAESAMYLQHTISVDYNTSDPRVHIKNITYDFTGTPVIFDPTGANTQVFDFPDDDDIIYNSEGGFGFYFSPIVNGNENDYLGGKVKIVLTDGTEFETTFTNVLTTPTSSYSGVEAVFNQNIDFLPPADLTFDLNDDGEVDDADVGLLGGLIAEWPCDSGVPGDLNGDAVVDRADVNIIGTYRNQPVSACPECDIDGDGMITVLDARKLVLQCTCPRCVCP